MDPETAGQRIARARRRRGLSQAVLAGLVGRSESWLSQVERGKRGIDSHAVLTRLAAALRIDVEEITGPEAAGEEGSAVYAAAPLIEQAMMRYGVAEEAARESQRGRRLDHLRAMARSAYQGYQATRYDATGRLLPGLIRGVEGAIRAGGLASPAACKVRARVYDIAAALLNRVGEPALAWTAADRAMTAAEYSGEPVLTAAAAWRLSYVITSRRHPREGLDLAMAAAGTLERSMRSPSPEQLSVYGALHLAAVTAAAASYDRTLTAVLLDKARGIADLTGESNHMGTAFGPVNVAIHAIAASLQLGDARDPDRPAHTGEPRSCPRVRHAPSMTCSASSPTASRSSSMAADSADIIRLYRDEHPWRPARRAA